MSFDYVWRDLEPWGVELAGHLRASLLSRVPAAPLAITDTARRPPAR
jgi:hypothetical protein